MSKLKYYLITTIGWFSYTIFMHYIYAHSPNPILDWAKSTLIPDYIVFYRPVLYVSSIAINLMMAFPFALLLTFLLPSRPWAYIGLATFLVFVWEYQNVWSDYETLLRFATTPRYYIGIAQTICMLPVAYFLAVGLRARYAA